MRKTKKASIVTKRGDKGITDLYCAVKVSKDDVRCEACGTIDELCSFLGLAKSMIKQKKTKIVIDEIQKNLFIVGSEVAVNIDKTGMLKERIDVSYVEKIENVIYQLEGKIVVQHGFIIPGKNKFSAVLDICRTVARRLERRIVTLKNKRLLRNIHILTYINRVSDSLYLLARFQEKDAR